MTTAEVRTTAVEITKEDFRVVGDLKGAARARGQALNAQNGH